MKTTFHESFKSIKESIHLIRDPEFLGLLFFVVIVLGVGTVFYTVVEGWRLLDSLYFSVITLTTIGFGDFAPHTDIGKIFTMIYILVGIGTIFVFLNKIARYAIYKNSNVVHMTKFHRFMDNHPHPRMKYQRHIEIHPGRARRTRKNKISKRR